MKIYQPGTRGKRTSFVQPGAEYPVTHWLDGNGKPRMFAVEFKEGEADVDDQLGQYMIDKGLAQRSEIILPAGVSV